MHGFLRFVSYLDLLLLLLLLSLLLKKVNQREKELDYNREEGEEQKTNKDYKRNEGMYHGSSSNENVLFSIT